MQTEGLVRVAARLLLAFLLPALVPVWEQTAKAQVLARPGWAGSGVVPEPWWRAAVFYRLDPQRFQATDGGAQGNVAGIAQRLDYLQSLGVDALVLDGTFDSDGLGDLVRTASQHRLRLVLTISPAMQAKDTAALVATVHSWMGGGVAGVFLPRSEAATESGEAQYAGLVTTIGGLVRGFPGERVLLLDPVDPVDPVVPVVPKGARAAVAGTSRTRPGAPAGRVRDGELTIDTVPVSAPGAAALRGSLEAVSKEAPGTSLLLRFAENPQTASAEAVADATLLLAARGAAMFDFGTEIGLDTASPVQAGAAPGPVMQWTPANVQQAAAAPVERRASSPDETEFGPYRPYVRPPLNITGGAPPLPHVTVDGNLPPTLPAPDTLPGFTSGALPNLPVRGDRVNVATEDRDPGSVLNAYRQLLALHHGNAALRAGTQTVLNQEEQNAVVWVRRAPAGSRTVADVVVAVNLGAEPLTMSLDGDLARLGMRSGGLRALFTSSPTPLAGERTGALRLPAHAVFVGELPRAGRGPG